MTILFIGASQPQHPVTPDGRYFVVRGTLCRMANPDLPLAKKSILVDELVKARSAVRSKHVGSASFLLRKRYQAAPREVLEETGAADPDADYRRLAEMEYRDDEMALFDSVLARIVSDGSLGRFSRAHVKETDRVKQLGFYVDLDDQMRVRLTPSQVTSELAKDRLNFAREVLETLRSISLIWTA